MRFATLAAFVALGVSAVAMPPLPRKSPEFTIADSSGKTMLLSSFKGKVVVMEFLFVNSQHCIRVATTLNKLNNELGPRGFQAVGVLQFPVPPIQLSGIRLALKQVLTMDNNAMRRIMLGLRDTLRPVPVFGAVTNL